MKTLPVGEFKTHFSEVIDDVRAGEEIIITYGKKKEQVAVVIPYSSYYKLPKKDDHKDPFDRLLIWYALNNELILITKDKKVEQYIEDGLRVMIGT